MPNDGTHMLSCLKGLASRRRHDAFVSVICRMAEWLRTLKVNLF